MIKALPPEIFRFLVVGFSSVAIDAAVYTYILTWADIDVSKAFGFIDGSIFGYLLNRAWTFESKAPILASGVSFSALYSLTFLANVSLNHFAIHQLSMPPILAFLIATSASTILNFLGMKFWVFRADSHASEIKG